MCVAGCLARSVLQHGRLGLEQMSLNDARSATCSYPGMPPESLVPNAHRHRLCPPHRLPVRTAYACRADRPGTCACARTACGHHLCLPCRPPAILSVPAVPTPAITVCACRADRPLSPSLPARYRLCLPCRSPVSTVSAVQTARGHLLCHLLIACAPQPLPSSACL